MIEPGVTVRFTRADYNLTVNGTLTANGTAGDSIRFIGTANPAFNAASTHGGVVNLTTSRASLSYLHTDSLGETYLNGIVGAVAVSINAQPTISNCLFTNTEAGFGISTWPGGAQNINVAGTITGLRGGSYSANAVIKKQGTGSYYRMLGPVTMSPGRLTIEPGVRIEFPNRTYSLSLYGRLTAIGTASDSIRFTGRGDAPSGTTHGSNIILYAGSDSSVMRYVVFQISVTPPSIQG